MSYRTIADFYKEDENINPSCVNYFMKRKGNEVRDIEEAYKKLPNPRQSNHIQSNHIQSNHIQSNHIQSNPRQSNHIQNIENFDMKINKSETVEVSDMNVSDNNLTMTFQINKVNTLTSPGVWGPSFWFILHNSANSYENSPSPLTVKRMKNFIIGIPIMVPCASCREHSTGYIEEKMDKLDDICSNKDKLFNFFVDFHNFVNKRLNKPIMSYDEATKLYSGKVEIKTLSYK